MVLCVLARGGQYQIQGFAFKILLNVWKASINSPIVIGERVILGGEKTVFAIHLL